jgi:nucleoid DNA-binding protein
MTQKEAEVAVESALEIIKEELSSGQDVMISGFGNGVLLTKEPRKGRNKKRERQSRSGDVR